MEEVPILQLKNIYFDVNDQPILKSINFNLKKGEIHAIVGEHRAGKTSLIKIITGENKKSRGSIFMNGVPVDIDSPIKALSCGIGVVYQEPILIPNLNAVENIAAGTIHKRILNRKYYLSLINKCRKIFSDLDFPVNLENPVSRLTSAEQQMVEFARLIYLESDIIIIDEISSRLKPSEMMLVFRFLKKAKKDGRSIIFIDSDIDNVLRIADRVTIIHNGFIQSTEHVEDLDRLKLIELTYNFVLNIQDEETSKQLVLMKRYNENVFSDLPAGIIVFDSGNRLETINAAGKNILQLDSSLCESCSLDEIFTPESFDIYPELLECIKARETRIWNEVHYKNKKTLKIKLSPYSDYQNRFRGTIFLIEDISIDNSLKEYLVRTEKIAIIAELAAGVSHEINNPLGIIHNYVQILLYRSLDDDTLEKLEKIETQLKRITDITNSLLSFSRLKQIPNREFNLVTLINEVILLMNHKLKEKDIHLYNNIDKDEIMIRGNENRLRQVFVNILNNSIEAVLNGGIISVNSDIDKKGGFVQISIRDNGCGIPEHLRSSIFSPFFSTKVTRNNGGLGLSVCQHIIEAHKGVITFESTPGDHTTFIIKLPF